MCLVLRQETAACIRGRRNKAWETESGEQVGAWRKGAGGKEESTWAFKAIGSALPLILGTTGSHRKV